MLHLRIVDTDEFFIKGDGQRRFTTELRHEAPLLSLDRLLNTMDGILREQFKLIEGIFKRKGAIGIEA